MKQYLSRSDARMILIDAGISTQEDKICIEQIFHGEGGACVFCVKCEGSIFIVKIFSHEGESKVLTAKKFYDLAFENQVPVPKILASGRNSDSRNCWWLLMEYKPGYSLHQLKNKPQRQEAATLTGKYLRKLHSVETTGFGYLNNSGEWIGQTYDVQYGFYTNKIARLLDDMNSQEVDILGELKEIFHYVKESEGLVKTDKPYLLHGDITGGNVIVIVSENYDVCLIDPGRCISGDPMADLAYSQTTRVSPEFRVGIWEGYGGSESLSRGEWERFLIWRLLRQLVVVCEAIQGRDEEVETHGEVLMRLWSDLK